MVDLKHQRDLLEWIVEAGLVDEKEKERLRKIWRELKAEEKNGREKL